MNIDWSTVTAVILASIPGIIVAFVSSLLAARQARKQHISQRWWEKKAEVYGELLNALHGLKAYYDNRTESYMMPDDGFLGRKAPEFDGYRNKFDEILNVGTFAISQECLDLLKTLNGNLEKALNERSPFEYFDSCGFQVKGHIEKIIAAAKKDLGVR